VRVHGSAYDPDADRDDADADHDHADADADADDTHADADPDDTHADPHEDASAPAPGADWPGAPAGACSYTRRQHLPGDRLRIAPPRGRPAQPAVRAS
jgi:hypothetical protein